MTALFASHNGTVQEFSGFQSVTPVHTLFIAVARSPPGFGSTPISDGTTLGRPPLIWVSSGPIVPQPDDSKVV